MKIDFVVTWLDANDPEWIASYNQLRGGQHSEDKGRYRNWDFFRYWFRAVENYAPWVNKVFLVTNGKFPNWINPQNPKLVLVKHADYMLEKYLPTFNSCAIEINFNRIKGLSEHFVYFNDDFYINGPVTPDYYFKDGLPCDCNAEKFSVTPFYSPEEKFRNRIKVWIDAAVLNYHFDRRKTISQAPWKWYGPHLWGKHLLASLILHGSKNFQAFTLRHNEQPMLKSVIQEIWDAEPLMCEQTCSQFRQDVSLNPYIIRYWQFASNKFYPMRKQYGKYFGLGQANLSSIINTLLDTNIKSVCLNDGAHCSDEAYFEYKKNIIETFEKKFPNKSSYEL
jgi:hypothetical protein